MLITTLIMKMLRMIMMMFGNIMMSMVACWRSMALQTRCDLVNYKLQTLPADKQLWKKQQKRAFCAVSLGQKEILRVSFKSFDYARYSEINSQNVIEK